jgi:hypothetical protein
MFRHARGRELAAALLNGDDAMGTGRKGKSLISVCEGPYSPDSFKPAIGAIYFRNFLSGGEHVMVPRVKRPTPPDEHWLTKTAFVLMITGLVAVEVVLRTGILAVPENWPH